MIDQRAPEPEREAIGVLRRRYRLGQIDGALLYALLSRRVLEWSEAEAEVERLVECRRTETPDVRSALKRLRQAVPGLQVATSYGEGLKLVRGPNGFRRADGRRGGPCPVCGGRPGVGSEGKGRA